MTTNTLFTPKQNIDIADWLKEHAPAIAFFAGNGLLLLGEVRVYDYALTQTGEVWKAWFAVLASFAPFVIWEIGVQHDKANAWMRLYSWIGMTISMALGIFVGVADFIMIDGSSPNSSAILTWLALSLSVHALLLLAYYYSHPQIKAKRLMAEALGREELARTNAGIARNILEAARGRLALEREIAGEFGDDELQKVLASLTGQQYTPAEHASLFGAGLQIAKAAGRTLGHELAPAGQNGNGHKAEEKPKSFTQ